jgi:hypothetical protein
MPEVAELTGVSITMPSSMTRQKNEYICPAGEALIWHYSYVEKGLKLQSLLEFEMLGLRVEIAVHTEHGTTSSTLGA